MTPRERLLALALSFVGLAACTGAVMAFVLNVMRNKLPWHPHQSAREYYLAVGQSFSEGFALGFFLCFFLALIAAVVSSWVQHRRAAVASAQPATPDPILALRQEG
jgi:hypothetical protein